MRFSFAPSKTDSARLLAVCAASFAMASAAAPAPSASDGVLTALQTRYEGITDLRAEFIQEAHIASLDKRDVSRGRVIMQRPGRMRWEYVDPQARVIVLDEGTLRIYTPSDAQLQVASAGAGSFSSTALGFLLGKGDLRASFTSERLDSAGREEIGLRLRPKEDAAFDYLEMWLAPATHQLRESVVVDVFGNRTSVRFTKITENAGVDAAAFQIEIPEGTEVIDLR